MRAWSKNHMPGPRTDEYIPQLDVPLHQFPSGHVVYLYHALGKGYFRENGLMPVFSRLHHSPRVVEAVARNLFKIGTAQTASVLWAASEYVAEGGKPGDFPVKIIYQADQNFSSAFYSLADSYRAKLGLALFGKDLTTLDDLIGKTVQTGGGWPHISARVALTRHGFAERINPSVELNGFQADKINVSHIEEYDVKTYSSLLLSGRLDPYAKPLFGHGQFRGRALSTNPDLKYSAISMRDLGAPSTYGIAVIARRDFVEAYPEMVRGFVRALDRAMPQCIQDPSFGVGIMNRLRGFGPEYDAIEGIKADICVGRHPEITGPGGFFGGVDAEKYGYGIIRRERLEEMIALLKETNALRAPLRPDDILMNWED